MHFDFLKRALLLILIICFSLGTQRVDAAGELSLEDDYLNWGSVYFVLDIPAYHNTTVYMREDAISADENYFYKILGSPLGSNQIQSPYYVHRYDIAGWSESGVLEIDGDPEKLSFGTYVSGLVGKDPQDKYLYFTCNGSTALIDKESFTVYDIVPCEFGQSNYYIDGKIYTFRPTGVYLFENGNMSLYEACDILVDKENTVREIAGEIVYLARKDGVLKAGFLDPETGTVSYRELEEMPGVSVNDPATKNYLLGISPTGQIVSAARHSDLSCYIREWNILGDKDEPAQLLRHFSFQQDANYSSSSSSGAYPVFDHYLNINYIYTSSIVKTTGVASVSVYPLDDPAAFQTQSYAANRRIPTVKWDGPVFGLEMQDGYVYVQLSMNRSDLPSKTKTFDMKGETRTSEVTHTASLTKYAGVIKYAYRLKNHMILTTYDTVGGTGQFYAFKSSYKTIVTEIPKPEPQTPPEEEPGDDPGNGGASGNGGSGGGAQEPGEGPGGGGLPVASKRYRLHRVY